VLKAVLFLSNCIVIAG